jgi:hypothetical protein
MSLSSILAKPHILKGKNKCSWSLPCNQMQQAITIINHHRTPYHPEHLLAKTEYPDRTKYIHTTINQPFIYREHNIQLQLVKKTDKIQICNRHPTRPIIARVTIQLYTVKLPTNCAVTTMQLNANQTIQLKNS